MQDFIYHSQFSLEDNYWWFVARNRIVESFVKKYIKLNNDSFILDIGCGPGAMSKVISENYNVVGIDMSPLAVEYARKRGLNHIYNSKLEDFDHKNYNISAAIMLDVIEHIESDHKIVKDIYNLLPKDSYFIATVPAYMWLWSIHDVHHMHFRRYNRKNFQNLFLKAGFQIEYISYFNTLLFPLAALKRLWDKFSGTETVSGPVDEVSPFVNKLFTKIFLFEKKLLETIRFPFGVSLIAVCKKK